MYKNYDVIILGAGAAGLMCAIEAGKRNRSVLVLDHSNKPGKKILMSGGGHCNFTNLNISPECYISHNPHFCKSALSRYTQWDFLDLVKKHKIPFHEKKHGQLFCRNKSKDILEMLLAECQNNQVQIKLNHSVTQVQKLEDQHFLIQANAHQFKCQNLVIATGGLSIPTLGASPFGYKIAEQFNIKTYPTRAGLVPFTLHSQDKQKFTPLSGISNHCLVSSPHHEFMENILFTHRGLSGPAILQISSYWHPGEEICINFLPHQDLNEAIQHGQKNHPTQLITTFLSKYLPKRLSHCLLEQSLQTKTLKQLSDKDIKQLIQLVQAYMLKPNATEGYRTAEVTLGGVDCNALSSKTMESHKVPGLYFIGEVMDVTGWLGGYNFQWAWSSGWAAGQVV